MTDVDAAAALSSTEITVLIWSVVLLLVQVVLQATSTYDLGPKYLFSPRDEDRHSRHVVAGRLNRALKNLLDHFLEEYFFRPSAIVCYSAGSFGGVRAAMQLRMTLAELGTVTIPSLLPIPKVQDAFDEQGQPSDPATERRARRFFDEMDWYAHALQMARGSGTPT